MKLLIIDADVIDLIQSGCELAYISSLPDIELVPSRRAREQANASEKSFTLPLGSEKDAPVALILNDPNRGINDPGVVMLPNELDNDEARLRQSSYSNCSFESHKDDMEVIASACRLWSSKRSDSSYSHFFFISGDRQCCKKARNYFANNGINIEVLYARKHGSKAINGIREVLQVFPK